MSERIDLDALRYSLEPQVARGQTYATCLTAAAVLALVEAVEAAQRSADNLAGDAYLLALDQINEKQFYESVCTEHRRLDAALARFGDNT